MASLTLSQLTKTFGATHALRDVSFTVAPGERVALLGHNGAGKSTLMKIVLGLIAHDSGDVQVLGAAPGDRAARRQVAYLPENVAFHPALTGLEQLCTYLRLRGQPVRDAMGLLERVGLGHAAKRRIGTYSKGMRQRVGLAQALIGTPRLLVLDEPTSGLDPVSRRDFYTTLDGLAADGASILLSSHALTEVEARTDRIVILSQGVMVANASLAQLRQQAALPIQMQVCARDGTADRVASALGGVRFNGSTINLSFPPDQKLARLSQVTALADLVKDVDVIPPSLEDLYSHFSKQVRI